MGTWAAYLACRASGTSQEIWPDSEPWGDPSAGWSIVQAHVAADLSAALAAAAGPALAAAVCDSDFAHVVAAVDGMVRWEVFLHEETAAEYGAPVPETPGAGDDELHQRIGVWAAEAGSAPIDLAELRRVLGAHYVFADDTLHELTRVLGIMTASAAPPMGGDEMGPELEIQLLAGHEVFWEILRAELEALAERLDAYLNLYPPSATDRIVGLDLDASADHDDAFRQVAALLRRLGLSSVRLRLEGAVDWVELSDVDPEPGD
jgi:biopolymer transport protein ExbD